MSRKKLTPEDFGCLVRPKLLSSAFVLESSQKQDLEPWWYDAKFFERSGTSSSYKQKAITRVFGPDPFPQGRVVAKVSSMLLSAKGMFFLEATQERVNRLMAAFPYDLKLRAVGVSLFECSEAGEVGRDVTPRGIEDPGALLLYRPLAVVRLEDCLLHESLSPGDVVRFQKTSALVLRVGPSKRGDWTSQVVWVMKPDGEVTTIASGRRYTVTRQTR